jgi:hypothetical protein
MKTQTLARKIGTYFLAGALALGAIGCGGKYAKEYEKPSQGSSQLPPKVADKVSELEGRILDVQQGSVPMYHGNHPIVHVQFRGKDGKLYSFLYPTTIGVNKTKAKLSYRQVEGNQITFKEFLENFVNTNSIYTSDMDSVIKTDGIITSDGIQYQYQAEAEK